MATDILAVKRPRAAHADVLRELEQLCAALAPGDRVPTHIELVRRLGVSERAVLRALDELQRGGRIVRRHGSGTYISDVVGASPATGRKTRTVVALTEPDGAFFDRCMDRLFRHAEAADLTLSCRPVSAHSDPAEVVASLPPDDDVIGYIVFRNALTPVAKLLLAQGRRVVIVGAPRPEDIVGVPRVYGDHEQGGYDTARHLLDLGHRRLAFFEAGIGSLRWAGYQRAIAEVERRESAVDISLISRTDLDAWMRQPEDSAVFFRGPKAPTATVAWNDHEAARISVILGRLGIRVPEDMALTGYDALPEGDLVYPPLTTVDQGMDRQLRAALDLLTQPSPPEQHHTVVILPTLLVRDSSGAGLANSGRSIAAASLDD